MSEIKSLGIERQLMSGILKYPNKFYEIISVIDNTCFSNSLYKTLYSVINQFISQKKSLDSFLMTQEISKLGLKFEVDNIMDHIDSLRLISVNEGAITVLAKQLRTIKERRNLISVGQKLIDAAKNAKDDEPLSTIIGRTDAIYNGAINPLYALDAGDEQDIYQDLYEFILDKGKNPDVTLGFDSPYPWLNKIFGPIMRSSNFSVIAARSGVGKSTMMLDCEAFVSERYNVPVLHLDVNEMTVNDLRYRTASSITSIPLHLLESGNFTKNADFRDRIDLISAKQSKIKIFHKNIGAMSTEEIISCIRRFCYKHVGRGHKNGMLLALDYIKLGTGGNNANETYINIGKLISDLKSIITELEIPLLTSVQTNRSGVINNKSSKDLLDNEETLSLSDEILRQSAFSFILRPLTLDESEIDIEATHKLIPLKARFLGESRDEYLKPVKCGKKMIKNYLRFKMENFKINELGTAREFIRTNEFNETPKKEINFDLP